MIFLLDSIMVRWIIFGREKVEQIVKRVLQSDDILDQVDGLGILPLVDFGLEFSRHWHGSRQSNEGLKAVRYNQATLLQVTATVLIGIIWAIQNPRKAWSNRAIWTINESLKSPIPTWPQMSA